MSKVEETNNAINDAETIAAICAEIAIGGTLVHYCIERGLNYKIVNRWIADDETRAARYKLALDIREEHAKDLIISELIAYMKARPVDAFKQVETENGTAQALLELQDMPAELQRLIAGIEFEELFEWRGAGKDRERVHIGRLHKIKFWDKPKSIETFMKHLAMLVDRKEIKNTLSLAELIAGKPADTVKDPMSGL